MDSEPHSVAISRQAGDEEGTDASHAGDEEGTDASCGRCMRVMERVLMFMRQVHAGVEEGTKASCGRCMRM
jgi:bacterioferritin-associated ferredoxin